MLDTEPSRGLLAGWEAGTGSKSRACVAGMRCLLPVFAFPSYWTRLPNANRVPCPANATGCQAGDAKLGQPAWACFGLGHATCQGGTFPLNRFGVDFARLDYWSELCPLDSDGDGWTNGQELGDPCCEWASYDTPSREMQALSRGRGLCLLEAWTPTHPGVATDFPTGEPRCGASRRGTRRREPWCAWAW